MPPCKVMRTLTPVDSWVCESGVRVFDLGENMTGWARITVRGVAGREVVLKYGELLDSSRDGGRVVFSVEIPQGVSARLILPDGSSNSVGVGESHFSVSG